MRKALLVGLFLFLFPSFAWASGQNYDKLLPLAKKYIGVPYEFGGTSEKGFDCSGFTRHVMSGLGVSLPRTTADQYKEGTAVSKSDLRPGDLVFFETYKSGASHAGVYIGDGKFIHASSSNGITINRLSDSYYAERYIGARRVLSYPKKVGEFQDIGNDFWAKNEIAYLNKEEKLLGYEDSYFYPNELMTRAEVAGVLATHFGFDMNNRKQTFQDVTGDHWAVGAINALVKGKIISSDKYFYPNEPITREQLAQWFVNAWKWKRSTSVPFTDVKEGETNYEAIQTLVAVGVAKGFEDGTFRPKEPVTRAQFAVFLYRALQAK